MAATKNTAKSAPKAEDVFADAQKAFEAGTEKFGKGFEDVTAFGQETLDALVKSSEIATKVAEDLNGEIADFSKKSFDETVAAAKDIATAKTPTELFEKQAAFATSAFEGFFAQATKWNEAFTAGAKASFEPVNAHMDAAADLAKTYKA
ncbi:MAG: phasin family protein [Rhodobacteraceae bacterium]|nr:phasin family protein [Paracoccaceae bacterium]